jgi:HK97 family phage portal protein
MTEQAIVTRRLSPEAAEMLRLSIDRQVESACKDFTIKLSQFHSLFDRSTWVGDDNESTPRRPYSQVALVFTCVNKLISSISGLPLVLSTIDEKIIESGPVYDVLFNNPLMSFQKFVTDTIGHYALSRDVFWVFTDMQGRQPKEIAVISGSQMHPKTHNNTTGGLLLGWEFRGTGGERAIFTLDEVYQWKNFNPYDKFHGLGPVVASKLNINYSYAADLYNAYALANGAEPGIILTTQGKLDPEQVQLLRSQFEARHMGAAKAKRTAVLTGGMDAKTVAMKMTDLQVAKITEMSDKKLCSTFGVPPGVAGLITEAQYSHGPAMQDFIFNTVIPLARLFAGELTYGIISKFYSSDSRSVEPADSRSYRGRRLSLQKKASFKNAIYKAVASKNKLFAWFDYDQHPVVQEVNRDIAAKVLDYTKAGVPLNDIIETHDLPYEQVDWGNDWWIGMGQVPARYALEAGLEGLTGPPLPEGGAGGEEETVFFPDNVLHKSPVEQKADEQQRLRIWRNWVISWAGIEREYKEAMRKFFVRQQRILIGKLKKAIAELRGAKDEQRATSDDIIARVVFDLKVENGKIKVINQTFFEKAGELGARQSLSEILGISGEALDQVVEQAKRMQLVRASLIRSSHKITSVNRTTQNMVAHQLQEGLQADEGLGDLTARIKKTLGSRRAKALDIARTQTAGAVGTGRHAGMKQAGVELKGWLSARDKDVRDSHREAEQRYAEGIALGVPFQVGGELLMYPADPAGSAANIINCRCVEIAMRAAGKAFGLAYYANLQFYSYSDMQKEKQNGT